MAVPRVIAGSESPMGGGIQGSSKDMLRCLELDAVGEGSVKVSKDTNLQVCTTMGLESSIVQNKRARSEGPGSPATQRGL